MMQFIIWNTINHTRLFILEKSELRVEVLYSFNFPGWFYGPDVTLQDCLAFFFSEDELKGDNMYSCEKCKKLRNGLKYSKVRYFLVC